MNHIATAEPSASGVDYSLLIMEAAMAVKMAVKTAVEMAPGAIPRPAGCRNREFCPPNWSFATVAAPLESFWSFVNWYCVFRSKGLL
jgi:hypothetical protein